MGLTKADSTLDKQLAEFAFTVHPPAPSCVIIDLTSIIYTTLQSKISFKNWARYLTTHVNIPHIFIYDSPTPTDRRRVVGIRRYRDKYSEADKITCNTKFPDDFTDPFYNRKTFLDHVQRQLIDVGDNWKDLIFSPTELLVTSTEPYVITPHSFGLHPFIISAVLSHRSSTLKRCILNALVDELLKITKGTTDIVDMCPDYGEADRILSKYIRHGAVVCPDVSNMSRLTMSSRVSDRDFYAIILIYLAQHRGQSVYFKNTWLTCPVDKTLDDILSLCFWLFFIFLGDYQHDINAESIKLTKSFGIPFSTKIRADACAGEMTGGIRHWTFKLPSIITTSGTCISFDIEKVRSTIVQFHNRKPSPTTAREIEYFISTVIFSVVYYGCFKDTYNRICPQPTVPYSLTGSDGSYVDWIKRPIKSPFIYSFYNYELSSLIDRDTCPVKFNTSFHIDLSNGNCHDDGSIWVWFRFKKLYLDSTHDSFIMECLADRNLFGTHLNPFLEHVGWSICTMAPREWFGGPTDIHMTPLVLVKNEPTRIFTLLVLVKSCPSDPDFVTDNWYTFATLSKQLDFARRKFVHHGFQFDRDAMRILKYDKTDPTLIFVENPRLLKTTDRNVIVPPFDYSSFIQ